MNAHAQILYTFQFVRAKVQNTSHARASTTSLTSHLLIAHGIPVKFFPAKPSARMLHPETYLIQASGQKPSSSRSIVRQYGLMIPQLLVRYPSVCRYHSQNFPHVHFHFMSRNSGFVKLRNSDDAIIMTESFAFQSAIGLGPHKQWLKEWSEVPGKRDCIVRRKRP